jgi:hypothetical protein
VASHSSWINKTISHHTEEVRKMFQSANSPQWCKSCGHTSWGHVINIVELWPQDIQYWGEFALWNLSFWPLLCDDILSCFFTKSGRPRDKCRWSMTTRFRGLRWGRTLKPLLLSGVSLVVILQRHLSRGLPLFVKKQDNRSSHRGGQKDRLQSASSSQWCMSCDHTSTTFITWPPSLRGWPIVLFTHEDWEATW